MRHRLFLCTLACLGAILPATRAAAQFIPVDGVYTDNSRNKPRYRDFVIASASPQVVVLKTPKAEIPAEQIVDIVFPLLPKDVHLNAYRQAIIAEKTAQTAVKPAERAKGFADALGKYEETLEKLDPDQPLVQSHLKFKIAYILYLQGREEGKEAAAAQAAVKLKDFVKANPKAWQLVRALRMLARLQLDRQQYAEAEETYRTLAKADVAPAVRQDAEVEALLITVQSGKYAEAQKSLEELVLRLAKENPKGSPAQMRARLALAECLGVSKNPKELARAKGEVKTVLDQTTDKALRAVAYNTLGYCYYLNELWQDARWEFLWVDTIYNQDPREHAKALYYLADIFARLGDGDRSREFRELLLTGREFAGLEYQRKALKEEKSP